MLQQLLGFIKILQEYGVPVPFESMGIPIPYETQAVIENRRITPKKPSFYSGRAHRTAKPPTHGFAKLNSTSGGGERSYSGDRKRAEIQSPVRSVPGHRPANKQEIAAIISRYSRK